jgi:uncharacterized membrane protein
VHEWEVSVTEVWATSVDMDAAAPPYEHRNPSAWRQRWPIAALAAIATIAASYMSMFQWNLVGSVWDPVFGDGSVSVLDSRESHRMYALLGVPDAAFGAWGYLSEAILSLVGSTRRWQFRPWLVILFGLDVISLGIVSSVLVVVQGLVIGSWCFLCLATAAISLVLVFMAYDEVRASVSYLARVWRETRSARLVWDTFCGRASAEAHRLAGVA